MHLISYYNRGFSSTQHDFFHGIRPGA